MSEALEWVKRDFCRLHNIPLESVTTITQHGRDNNNDYGFMASGPKLASTPFMLERISLSPYSEHKGLSLDKEYKHRPELLTKEIICRWFNSHTDLGLTPEDIGYFVPRVDRVTVAASVNSMRFKHNFYMRFK